MFIYLDCLDIFSYKSWLLNCHLLCAVTVSVSVVDYEHDPSVEVVRSFIPDMTSTEVKQTKVIQIYLVLLSNTATGTPA